MRCVARSTLRLHRVWIDRLTAPSSFQNIPLALRHDVGGLEAGLKRARDFAAGAQRRYLATAKERCVRACVRMGMCVRME